MWHCGDEVSKAVLSLLSGHLQSSRWKKTMLKGQGMKCQIPMITQDQVSSSDNSPGSWEWNRGWSSGNHSPSAAHTASIQSPAFLNFLQAPNVPWSYCVCFLPSQWLICLHSTRMKALWREELSVVGSLLNPRCQQNPWNQEGAPSYLLS